MQVIHSAQKQTVALWPADRRDIDDAVAMDLRLGLQF